MLSVVHKNLLKINMRIQKLKNKHTGDIWVLGSGAQMDMYNPEFFKDKITIGVNWVYKFFPCTYLMARHYKVIEQATKDKQNLVCPVHTCDADGIEHNLGTYRFNDELLQDGYTSNTAIDLARYMGAERVIVLGCEGYGDYMKDYPTKEIYRPQLNKARNQMDITIERLEKKYKIRIDWNKLTPKLWQ